MLLEVLMASAEKQRRAGHINEEAVDCNLKVLI